MQKIVLSDKHTDRAIVNADSMIEHAKSLQCVAKELENNGHEAGHPDYLRVQGVFLAVPVLLSLATEIALKAWWYQDRNKAPTHTHDLLKLFEELKPGTQDMLEARMRKVSPHAVWTQKPSMENLTPDLQEMFAARMRPLRDVLREHRNAHVHWRFLYEKESFAKFETAEIDRALTVIIDAYDEREKS